MLIVASPLVMLAAEHGTLVDPIVVTMFLQAQTFSQLLEIKNLK